MYVPYSTKQMAKIDKTAFYTSLLLLFFDLTFVHKKNHRKMMVLHWPAADVAEVSGVDFDFVEI